MNEDMCEGYLNFKTKKLSKQGKAYWFVTIEETKGSVFDYNILANVPAGTRLRYSVKRNGEFVNFDNIEVLDGGVPEEVVKDNKSSSVFDSKGIELGHAQNQALDVLLKTESNVDWHLANSKFMEIYEELSIIFFKRNAEIKNKLK